MHVIERCALSPLRTRLASEAHAPIGSWSWPPTLFMVAPRHRSTTAPMKPAPATAAPSPAAAPLVSLRGWRIDGRRRNVIRTGIGTPSPKAMTSPVPSDGMKVSRLLASDTAAARKA